MLLARVLTGLALIVGVYFLVFYGTALYFFLLVAVAILFSQREFYALLLPGASGYLKLVGGLVSLTLVSFIYFGWPDQALTFLALGAIAVMAIGLMASTDFGKNINEVSISLLGVLYIGLLLSFLVMIRNQPLGQGLVFLVFLLTWAQDVGAFFVGRFFGKRKLFPTLSPGKTLEGFLAGLFLATLLAGLSRGLLVQELGVIPRLFLGLGLGLIGPLGDLFESMLKRSVGVKDTGRVFPGHGGFLDRVDSLLFGGPFAYYYLRVVFPAG